VVLDIGLLKTGIRQLAMTNRDGFEYKEEDQNVFLTVRTLCPTKWILVDRETGQTYQGNAGGYWDRLDPVKKVDK